MCVCSNRVCIVCIVYFTMKQKTKNLNESAVAKDKLVSFVKALHLCPSKGKASLKEDELRNMSNGVSSSASNQKLFDIRVH